MEKLKDNQIMYFLLKKRDSPSQVIPPPQPEKDISNMVIYISISEIGCQILQWQK